MEIDANLTIINPNCGIWRDFVVAFGAFFVVVFGVISLWHLAQFRCGVWRDAKGG